MCQSAKEALPPPPPHPPPHTHIIQSPSCQRGQLATETHLPPRLLSSDQWHALLHRAARGPWARCLLAGVAELSCSRDGVSDWVVAQFCEDGCGYGYGCGRRLRGAWLACHKAALCTSCMQDECWNEEWKIAQLMRGGDRRDWRALDGKVLASACISTHTP